MAGAWDSEWKRSMLIKDEWYAEKSEADAVLIFGEVTSGKYPPVALAHFGQDAYEMYQIAVYLKELTRVRASDYLCWAPGFRAFGEMARALLRQHGKLTVEEFGSTLFSTIDKLDKLLVGAAEVSPSTVTYYGVEISQTFREMAEHLHPNHSVHHVEKWHDLPPPNNPLLGRAYQATSYGMTSTEELAEWTARSALALQGVWVVSDGEERTTQFFGKRLHLFSFEKLRGELEKRGRMVAVLSSQQYTFKDESFVDVWMFTYDPRQIDVELLGACFARDTGRNLRGQDVANLRPDGKTLVHAGGLSSSAVLEGGASRTFNFGNILIQEAYESFKNGERKD